MKKLIYLLLAFSSLKSFGQSSLIDFGNLTEKNQEWVLLSDNVMGGVTKSKIEYTNNSVLLFGNISLDNYGGFSSIKTKYKSFDLSKYMGIKIKFKSTNQKFAFTLEDNQNWTQPNYKHEFSAKKDDTWEEVIIYFKDFQEIVIGEPTGNMMKSESLKNIVRMGIMTYEKKEGPFSIEVDFVDFIK
jgi:NADH dehydrogenase [ubiquinone] 1 alpha subcomplex assembly factor 1